MAEFDCAFDVVVVGSGGGVAGAYTAAREGLSVLLVESTEQFGGTTAAMDVGADVDLMDQAWCSPRIGVPKDNLTATIARFNQLAAEGKDLDFGRGEETYDRAFTAAASPLLPIDTPPYHAAVFGLSDLGTKGGLRTDVRGRMLATDGAVLPGLHAAGNTMAAVTGTTYPGGGNPIGASMLFSHFAALDMAERVGDT